MTKKVTRSPQVRMIELLLDILTTTHPIPLEHYDDGVLWGDERTFRRMRKSLNEFWMEKYQEPLFEITDEQGELKVKGDDRFISKRDKRFG
jgi:hypothetical protein